MASIQEALAKSAAKSAKSSSKNRGLRPYDVISKPLEVKREVVAEIVEDVRQVIHREVSPVIDKAEFILAEDFVLTEGAKNSEPIVDFVEIENIANQENQALNYQSSKNDHVEYESTQKVPDVELKHKEGQEIVVETAFFRAPARVESSIEALLDKAIEEAALKSLKNTGAVSGFDEYIEERGWNKVPHGVQKWILKNFKGNDLKGMYYFFYLAIRNRSEYLSVGYSAISEALGVDKKTAPRRIVDSLIAKGALSVEAPASCLTATKYKLIPMEFLLQQDPDFFKKAIKHDHSDKDIDGEASILKKYLLKNYDVAEVSKVIPKYKFILEKHSAAEVISLISSVNENGIFGIKPEKIGNVHAFLLSGSKIGDTFQKAFNSFKENENRYSNAEKKTQENEQAEVIAKQKEELFRFKAEQAKRLLYSEGDEAGKNKLEELKVKYRIENNISGNIPIVDNLALVYFYEQMARQSGDQD